MNGDTRPPANRQVQVHRVSLSEQTKSLSLPESVDGFAQDSLPRPATSAALDQQQRQQHSHRKHRSLSSPRTGSATATAPAAALLANKQQQQQQQKKPKSRNKYLSSSSTSLTSIPNAIKLSMLNSGLLSVGKKNLQQRNRFFYFCATLIYLNDLLRRVVVSARCVLRAAVNPPIKHQTPPSFLGSPAVFTLLNGKERERERKREREIRK